jgi:nitrogen regulatory protein PII
VKMIVAVIQPFRINDVREALMKIGVDGMTVSEVRGYGRQKGHKEIYRGAEYSISFVPKLKIEVAVTEDRTAAAVTAIREAAHSGQIGDGKIFVLSLDDATRIRTGESGSAAL